MFQFTPTSVGLLALTTLALPPYAAASRTYSCSFGYTYSGGILDSRPGTTLEDCMTSCESWGEVCVMGQFFLEYRSTGPNCSLHSAQYTHEGARGGGDYVACRVGPQPTGYQCQVGKRFDPEAAHSIQITDDAFDNTHCAELCDAQTGCTGFYVGAQFTLDSRRCYLATTTFDVVADDWAHLCLPSNRISLPAGATDAAVSRSYSCSYGYEYSGGELDTPRGKSLEDCMTSCESWGDVCVMGQFSPGLGCRLHSAKYTTGKAVGGNFVACRLGPQPTGYQCQVGKRFDHEAARSIQISDKAFDNTHCAELCDAQKGCTGFYIAAESSDTGSNQICYLATTTFDTVPDDMAHLCVPSSQTSMLM